jgi:acetyltransferase-like isoleucine patch superfamily enzyme
VATQAPGQTGAGNGLIDEVYEDFECLGDCDPLIGTEVITPDAPDSVSIVLASGDEPITGKVTAAADATPLGQVTIEVYDDLGVLVKTSDTNGLGEYTVDGLPDGDYTLVAKAMAGNYGAVLFDGLYCDGGCDVTIGTSVSMGNIANFSLPDDNCPNVDNPDQSDSDRNGRGDACELPVVADRANVDPSVIIDVGSEVIRGATVHANVKMGKQVLINRNAEIGARCLIGDRVTIGQNTVVGVDCRIGNDSTLDREGVYGTGLSVGTNTFIDKNAEVGNGVTIGNNVNIGRNAFIADGVCIPDDASYRKDSTITDTTLCN